MDREAKRREIRRENLHKSFQEYKSLNQKGIKNILSSVLDRNLLDSTSSLATVTEAELRRVLNLLHKNGLHELSCNYVIPDKGPGSYKLGILLWQTPLHAIQRRKLLRDITLFLGDDDFGGKSQISLKLEQDNQDLADFQLNSNWAIIDSYDKNATVDLKPGFPVRLEFSSTLFYQTIIPPKQNQKKRAGSVTLPVPQPASKASKVGGARTMGIRPVPVDIDLTLSSPIKPPNSQVIDLTQSSPIKFGQDLDAEARDKNKGKGKGKGKGKEKEKEKAPTQDLDKDESHTPIHSHTEHIAQNSGQHGNEGLSLWPPKKWPPKNPDWMPKMCWDRDVVHTKEWTMPKLLYYSISWMKYSEFSKLNNPRAKENNTRNQWTEATNPSMHGTKTLGSHFVFPFITALRKQKNPLNVEDVEAVLKSCDKKCWPYPNVTQAWNHIKDDHLQRLQQQEDPELEYTSDEHQQLPKLQQQEKEDSELEYASDQHQQLPVTGPSKIH